MSDETKTHAVTLYLKSGNVLPLHNLEDFAVDHDWTTGKLKSITWTISPNSVDPYKLLHVDLDSIEAVIIQEEE